MGRVRVDITMSLDGYIAGPDQGPDHPLGVGGEALHEWVVGLAAWRESHGKAGGEENVDSPVVEENIASTGATIMGRGMFGGGGGEWSDWQGWWGDEPPFGHPVFVLTHHEREPLTLGATTFTFVTDGIESALAQARDAAGDKDVLVAGGANAIQQYVRAGLVDEIQVHVVPVLLGGGTRLFDDSGAYEFGVAQTRAIGSDAVTHLRYEVKR